MDPRILQRTRCRSLPRCETLDETDRFARALLHWPSYNWFVIPEIYKRQYGTSSRKSSQLFNSKCCGALWSVKKMKYTYELGNHEDRINCLNFHPRGDLLVSGSQDTKLIVWDWKIPKPLTIIDAKDNVLDCKFLSLIGELQVASCGDSGEVYLSQISDGGLRGQRKLGMHSAACRKLSILHDQPYVVISVGHDGCVLRHDLRSSTYEKLLVVRSFDSSTLPLFNISNHPLDGNIFCLSGRDHIIRTFDQRKLVQTCDTEMSSYSTLNTYSALNYHNMHRPNYHVTFSAYNHNGTEILASYNHEDIYTFNVNSSYGLYAHHYSRHNPRNTILYKGINFFGPNSEFIVGGSVNGEICFWESNTEVIVQWLPALSSRAVNCVEPHPHLPYLCASGHNSKIKVYLNTVTR